MSGTRIMNAEQREHLRQELEQMQRDYPGQYVSIVTDDDPVAFARPADDPSWQGFEKPTEADIAAVQRAIDLGDELDGLRIAPEEQP
jgi:hypothetical protein